MPDSLVLVASANPTSWHRIREALKDRYAVTFAVDLQGVVDVLEKHRPPALILCSRLLNADLEGALRKLPGHLAGTRVVAVISEGDGSSLRAPSELGVDACLEDRWVPTALLPLLQGLLD